MVSFSGTNIQYTLWQITSISGASRKMIFCHGRLLYPAISGISGISLGDARPPGHWYPQRAIQVNIQ